MSRARLDDNQNAVQLFPFVAVLLCTMGSLLVLLVGVASSSKARALEEAAALQAEAQAANVVRAAESQENIEAARRELEQIAKYQAELDAVHAQAADRLHQDQARLSHLEDHMRRLREQLETLKLAAAELNALEDEHYDDREQARQEIERLQQLIDESRKTIEELRAEAKTRAKSYAIVPYQGRSGTRRRPVYIECREDDVVLQPEGVVFTLDDFQPPIGPGNPLVAAIRAAREHIIRVESNAAAGEGAAPYPLIIVRPKGIRFYYYVREAIQSWDSEFGYELVEEDWELKYAPADPQLATVEYEAAELARRRLQALAAAAPKAYGAYRYGSGGFGSGGFGGGDGDFGDDDFGDGGDGEGSSSSPTAAGGARFAARPGGGRAPIVVRRTGAGEGQDAGGKGAGGGTTDDRYTGQNSDGAVAATGEASSSPTTPGGLPGGSGSKQQPPADIERQPDGTPVSGAYTGGEDPEQTLDDMARAAAASESSDTAAERKKTKARGKDWAIRNANPGMIPIRRTIQVVVRGDALAILPEASATNESSAAGREFRFADAPEGAYEDLLSAVDQRIEDWGMAGQGLYWRPVVELKVSPDGERRFNDLARLLKHSGAEIRSGATAQRDEGGARGTNR